jgi:hypothetical protein
VADDSERGGQPAEDPEFVPELLELVRRTKMLVLAARENRYTSQLIAIARQVQETMGLEDQDPVIEGVRQRVLLVIDALDEVPGQDVRAFAEVAAVMGNASNASLAAGSLEGVSDLSTRAAEEGVARLTKMDVLALVLLWLVTLGAPVLQSFLPTEDQTVVTNEYLTVVVGAAITTWILDRRRR